jgi:ankyrin repeat protein
MIKQIIVQVILMSIVLNTGWACMSKASGPAILAARPKVKAQQRAKKIAAKQPQATLNKALLKASTYGTGDLKAVKQAIAQGADVNYTNKSGMTALMYAGESYSGDPEMVRFLLKNGANINLVDELGYTALTHAVADARGHNDQVIKILIKKWC